MFHFQSLTAFICDLRVVTSTLAAVSILQGLWTEPAYATDDQYATAAELGLMKGFPPPPDKRVTRSNALLTAPFNRWSYLRMRKIYPSAPIASADKAAAIGKSFDWSINKVKVKHPKTGAMIDMAAFLQQTYTDAFVVVRGDTIVYEKFFNGMHANQPHQMMSVTKSFAGLLGLMAVDAGKLKEEAPVVQYVPELGKASAFADATFGQVLDMTNSMDFTEDYATLAQAFVAMVPWWVGRLASPISNTRQVCMIFL